MATSREAVLSAIEGADEDTVTTAAVASALDISQPGAWKALTDLAAEGLVEKHPGPGLQSDTWSIKTDGLNYLRQGSG